MLLWTILDSPLSTTFHVDGHTDDLSKSKNKIPSCHTWPQHLNILCNKIAKFHISLPPSSLVPSENPIFFPVLERKILHKGVTLCDPIMPTLRRHDLSANFLHSLCCTKCPLVNLQQIDIIGIDNTFKKEITLTFLKPFGGNGPPIFFFFTGPSPILLCVLFVTDIVRTLCIYSLVIMLSALPKSL